MKKSRGEVRKLLVVIGDLQSKIGFARSLHFDDRSRNSFEKAQTILEEAFNLCVDTLGEYEQVTK